MTRNVILLETIHGSHLYGLSTPTSDRDYYRVVSNVPDSDKSFALKTRQSISDNNDVLETNLSAFMVKCSEGVPQALEAMFSPLATCSFEDFRKSYYVATAAFAKTYRRTILNFARLGLTEGRALDILAPAAAELGKPRVRESVREIKPGRVQRYGMLKYRRHSTRLLLNLEEGLHRGRFSPSLTDSGRDFVMRAAELEDEKFAILIKSRVDFS